MDTRGPRCAVKLCSNMNIVELYKRMDKINNAEGIYKLFSPSERAAAILLVQRIIMSRQKYLLEVTRFRRQIATR